jgi:TPR repeat protein
VKKVIFLTAILVCVSPPVFCGLEEGIAAGRAGDYTRALQELKPLAERGNAEAQFALAAIYQAGLGVPQDYQQALYWLRKSADQGNSKAQSNLGKMYSEAIGVPQDYQQALYWLRKSAEQGEAMAQYGLGLMYQKGDGVPKDIVLAYMLYTLAANGGVESALTDRDTLIQSLLSPRQIKEGQALVRAWKPSMSLPTSSKTGTVLDDDRPSFGFNPLTGEMTRINPNTEATKSHSHKSKVKKNTVTNSK